MHFPRLRIKCHDCTGGTRPDDSSTARNFMKSAILRVALRQVTYSQIWRGVISPNQSMGRVRSASS